MLKIYNMPIHPLSYVTEWVIPEYIQTDEVLSPKFKRPHVQKSKQEKRYKPGTVALREIRHFQKTWNLVIPAAPFIRHVREVSHFFAPEVTRWQAEVLIAIQEVVEDFLVHLFENAMLCAIHAKRVTLMK
ncbi:hypothetical protein H5410_012180 [Solanum commersonii]|uniref:Core Histone H2A/H2B/H3 domain-containing protein n=1 Tax=Solanum commersonii TaxID=4109 RepID=A0A9J6ARX0_SOLCO|nr:hypothetical protein H5410_012180 [Solanum commersonii]